MSHIFLLLAMKGKDTERQIYIYIKKLHRNKAMSRRTEKDRRKKIMYRFSASEELTNSSCW
jgi:hypothetical protein